MPAQPRSSITLLATVASLAMLGGCSSSTAGSSSIGTTTATRPSESPSSVGPSNSGSVGSPSSGGASVVDGLGHPANICSLLPASTVAQITGEPITVATEFDTLDHKIYACEYTSADGAASFGVSAAAIDAAAAYEGSLEAAGIAATPIQGLGDKAFSAFTLVQALFGDVLITVSNLDSTEAATALIRDLQPKL
jgi:hypothetical protein